MNSYQKIGWLDHVEDVETGEVIQEGTPVSQTNMNHMDDGIFENREAVILHEAQIEMCIRDSLKKIKDLEQLLAMLKEVEDYAEANGSEEPADDQDAEPAPA